MRPFVKTLWARVLDAAASSVSLSSDRQRALLVDFSCAVHQSTVIADDLVDVVREVLPPHVISPEVRCVSQYLTLTHPSSAATSRHFTRGTSCFTVPNPNPSWRRPRGAATSRHFTRGTLCFTLPNPNPSWRRPSGAATLLHFTRGTNTSTAVYLTLIHPSSAATLRHFTRGTNTPTLPNPNPSVKCCHLASFHPRYCVCVCLTCHSS